MHTPLRDRVALITGGAGGIGAATARKLAGQGAAVVVADRDGAAAERVAAGLRGEGLDVRAVKMDQTDPEQVEDAFTETVEAHGRLDICFANAGWGRLDAFLDLPLDTWNRHVAVNLTGTFLVCQTAARHMADGGRGGSIIVNSSNGAVAPAALFSAYCATKAALNMLVQVMAAELGAHDVRVNAVMPGVTATAMTKDLLEQGMDRLIESQTPLGRVGRPEDVAAMVAFLAGDDSSYVTGVAHLVDGGATHNVPRWFTTDYRRRGQTRWRLRHLETPITEGGGA
ncbi:SDR family NAD(P)-dependent oxidoreductase [Nonomuraea sp. NPDC050394]|uniref:SDR family NAD(P)-dependent oxidoreductase n=1 Tax=Nonomuraea sp. NPDC050394 TaxID=3364363 RepID=UPI0037B7E701